VSGLRAISSLRGPFVRFAVLGAAKTVATAALLYGLVVIMPPRVAYTLLYVAGLVVVALVTPSYVFGVRASRTRLSLLLGWYVVVYFVGLGVVSLLDALSDSRAVIAVGSVFITAPISFAGARLAVGSRPAAST
jgi:lysylphosphatidylglycerol synthetase-like protein (DUF2156 family)